MSVKDNNLRVESFKSVILHIGLYNCTAAPAYLSDYSVTLQHHSVGVHSLRSADSRTCCVPRRTHNGYGVCCFATDAAAADSGTDSRRSIENRIFRSTVLELC